jgi:hypothetical protein
MMSFLVMVLNNHIQHLECPENRKKPGLSVLQAATSADIVVPAKAGTRQRSLDSGLRRNDGPGHAGSLIFSV